MSKRWLQENRKDHYIKQAKEQGYPSRAAYKLLEIAKKDPLFKPGMTVIDLGAAPGGWSMVAAEQVGGKGLVIAVDLLPIKPTRGIVRWQKNCQDVDFLKGFENFLQSHQIAAVDVVLSDMAPNLSGIREVDQANMSQLVMTAWECVQVLLKVGGNFLVKLFQSDDTKYWVDTFGPFFKQIKCRKPPASRSRSREVYILCTGFLGYNQSNRQEDN